jgi:hypothetical protein
MKMAATLISETPIPLADLEAGEIATFTPSPVELPQNDFLEFCRSLRSGQLGHKDISFDPQSGRLTGLKDSSPQDLRRLTDGLSRFSKEVFHWLSETYPAYAGGLTPDRVTLRTHEEATRALRLMARNDLLHIDNFPTRPTHGRRILRFYVNIHPEEPHVWSTSERFHELLSRYLQKNRVSSRTAEEWTSAAYPSLLRLFRSDRPASSAYDHLMQRLHHFLKEDESFQGRAARRIWSFAPTASWLFFSDVVSHAQLRGRFALEHSFFVDQNVLTYPEASPLSVLVRGTSGTQIRQVA